MASRKEVFIDRSNQEIVPLHLRNLRETWAKRRYPANFVNKLTGAYGENSENDF